MENCEKDKQRCKRRFRESPFNERRVWEKELIRIVEIRRGEEKERGIRTDKIINWIIVGIDSEIFGRKGAIKTWIVIIDLEFGRWIIIELRRQIEIRINKK